MPALVALAFCAITLIAVRPAVACEGDLQILQTPVPSPAVDNPGSPSGEYWGVFCDDALLDYFQNYDTAAAFLVECLEHGQEMARNTGVPPFTTNPVDDAVSTNSTLPKSNGNVIATAARAVVVEDLGEILSRGIAVGELLLDNPFLGGYAFDGTKYPLSTGYLPPRDLNLDDANGSEIDPVNPANGEFYLIRADMAFPGKGVPFRFERIYRSRMAYEGPLGSAWDHNFNQRILPTGSESCEGEVIYHQGMGRAALLRKVSETAGEALYEAEAPSHFQLRHMKVPVGSVAWIVSYPDGTTIQFDTGGLLRRIQDATKHGLTVEWEAAVTAPQNAGDYRVKKVVDSASRSIEFKYDSKGRIDFLVEAASGLVSDYTYDDGANELRSVDDALGRRESYEYEAAPSLPPSSEPDFLPEQIALAACEQYCAPKATSCQAGGACDSAAVEMLDRCYFGLTECAAGCTTGCGGAFERTDFDPTPTDKKFQSDIPDDLAVLRQQLLDAGCSASCESMCSSSAQATAQYEACVFLANEGFCEEQPNGSEICNPVRNHPSVTEQCHSDCFQSCGFQEGNCYVGCSNNCRQGYADRCATELKASCRHECKLSCLSSSATDACLDVCMDGAPDVQGCEPNEWIGWCQAQDFHGQCSDSCVGTCLESVRGGQGSRPRFGKPQDLAHNMVRIKDGDGRLYLENQYGEDIHKPSFDAVIEQKTGEFTWTLDYRALVIEELDPYFAESVEGIGKQYIEGRQDYESVDICPRACAEPPFQVDPSEYIPWNGQLVVVKSAGKAGGLSITGQGSAALPPTLVKISAGNAAGSTLLATSTPAMTFPTGFTFKLATAKGEVEFSTTSSPAVLQVKGKQGALAEVAKHGELTILTETSGALRAYPGRPRGLVHLGAGSCTTAFTAKRSDAGQVEVSPTSACTGELLLSPLATSVEGAGYVEDYASNGPKAFQGLDLFAPLELVPARHSISLVPTDTNGRFDVAVGPREGRAPRTLAGATLAAAAVPLFAAPPQVPGATLPIFIFHVPMDYRPGDTIQNGPLYDSFEPFKPDFDKILCPLWIDGEPRRGKGADAPGPRPAVATVIIDGYGTPRAFYYDEHGQTLRTVTFDGRTPKVRSSNYNIYGDLVAQEEPLRDRVCAQYDPNGNVTELRQYPVPGAPGPTAPLIERFAYTPKPSRLATVYDPRDLSKVLQSFKYTDDGRLIETRDALNQVTTYAPKPWGAPSVVVGPDLSQTSIVYDDDNGSGSSGLPEDITIDATAAVGARLRTTKVYDPKTGRPEFEQGPLGATKTWNWAGKYLDSMTEDSGNGSQSVTVSYQYNGSAQPSRVTGPLSSTDLRYDLFGGVSRSHVSANNGSLPPSTTCAKKGPFGRVLKTLGPEGEYTEFVYDGEGRVISVLRGSAPVTLLEPWMLECSRSSDTLAPVSVGYVMNAGYDLNGRLEYQADARGAATFVTYDGFGRPIMIVDPHANERRIGYDRMGNVAWEASYGRPGTQVNPPYQLPSLSHVNLLAAVEYTYDEKARPKMVARWHFDENRQPVGDGKQLTTYSYDDVLRRMTVTDDANQSTVTHFDGAGRVIKRVFATGDQETFTYGVSASGGTVTRSWTTPTASGTRSETTKLTTWGAPLESGTSDVPGASQLVRYHYDTQFRADRIENLVTGARTNLTYDAFGRTHTTQNWFSGSVNELVTAFYDRSGHMVERRSLAGGVEAKTTYELDILGRPLRTRRPGGVFERYEYPPGSNSSLPSMRVDSRGVGSQFQYTDTGQLDTVTLLSVADGKTGKRWFEYDGLSRVLVAHDAGASTSNPADDVHTHFRWDSLGGKRREWNTLLGESQGISQSLDGLGRPVASTLGTTAISRQFDPLGRLTRLWLGSSTTGVPTAEWTYQGLGGAQQRKYANGVATAFVYDALGRLDRQTDTRGTAPVASWRWEIPLDGVPRLAGSSRGVETEVSSVYRTDGTGRLLGEDHGLAATIASSFTLDPGASTSTADAAAQNVFGKGGGLGTTGWGSGASGKAWRGYVLDGRHNWLQRTAGDAALALTPVLNAFDQYLGIGGESPVYDAVGGLVQSGPLQLTYNPFGEVDSVTSSGVQVTYRYDALGRRVAETRGGVTTLHGFDGPRRTLRKAGGAQVEVMVDGAGLDEHLVRIDSGGAQHFYHQGRDNSVYLVTSASGVPEESYQYTAYGEVTIQAPGGQVLTASNIGNRFGFQGQPFDSTTGLVDMRARLYRPTWGRFVSPDPIGFMGGANLYAFVNGAPTVWWDPTGLDNAAFDVEWDNAVGQARLDLGRRSWEEGRIRAGRQAEAQRQADGDAALSRWWTEGAARFNHNFFELTGLGLVAEGVTWAENGACGAPGCSLILGPFGLIGEFGAGVRAGAALGRSGYAAERGAALTSESLLVCAGGGCRGGAIVADGRAAASAARADGLGYAGSVLEGGTGRAFAGHGELRPGAGTVIVPEGTTVTIWTAEGMPLKDSVGQLVEAGSYSEIALESIEGARSFLPGATMPNYTLRAPNGLTVLRNSITVEDSTPLGDLLKAGMGHLDWAACLVFSCR